jgi:hypothetical protein
MRGTARFEKSHSFVQLLILFGFPLRVRFWTNRLVTPCTGSGRNGQRGSHGGFREGPATYERPIAGHSVVFTKGNDPRRAGCVRRHRLL